MDTFFSLIITAFSPRRSCEKLEHLSFPHRRHSNALDSDSGFDFFPSAVPIFVVHRHEHVCIRSNRCHEVTLPESSPVQRVPRVSHICSRYDRLRRCFWD